MKHEDALHLFNHATPLGDLGDRRRDRQTSSILGICEQPTHRGNVDVEPLRTNDIAPVVP